MLNRRDSFKAFAAAAAGLSGLGTLGTASASILAPANSPEFQGPTHPTAEGSWTMAVIPDTQSYVKFGRNQGLLEVMTAWLVENKEKYRIQQVLVTGDLVEQNGIKNPVGTFQSSDQQWKAFSRAMERLDGVFPYVLCTGNHDYGIASAENRETQMNKFFTPDRNPLWKGTLVEMGENTFGQKTLENAAYEFTTPSGMKTLTISLPFAPTDANLAWAKSVAAKEKYANHFVTVLTHSYIGANGYRIKSEGYALNREGGNAGEGIWQKFVKSSPNVRLVVCGHISAPDHWPGCVGMSFAKNDAGNSVAQMLFDTQALGGGWSGNGGDGWIRLLEFSADMKTVKARTFSPVFNVVPLIKDQAWEKADFNQFVFNFD